MFLNITVRIATLVWPDCERNILWGVSYHI